MSKPATFAGYDERYTRDCERLLVTLLRGLGPWKRSVCLIGGLTPRYLVPPRAGVPPHAGTRDVDIVVDLEILADVEAYRTLEQNLRTVGFERAENARGQKLSWRWQVRTASGALLVLELLADAPAIAGGRVRALPTEGSLSALNIPHASIVFDLYREIVLRAELLGDNGIVTETVRYADLVGFTCLKAIAFEQRAERKDAHDLLYCIEHAPEGATAVATMFRRALGGPHAAVVERALAILRERFASDGSTEGYRKDGAVAVAKFELGETPGPEERERRVLRQRGASERIERLLSDVGYPPGTSTETSQ